MEQKIVATLIIITHRSDKRFIRALDCGKWFEETLVVDAGSAQELRSLQKEYHFTLQTYPHRVSDFSKLRNFAMKHAKNDWVFFLDSDEYVTVDNIGELKSIISRTDVSAAWVARTDIFLGRQMRHGESGKYGLIRLLNRNYSSFKNPVHEVAQVKGKVSISNIIIYHQPHLSLSDFIAKVSIYAMMLGQQPNPKKSVLIKMFLFPPLKFLLNYVIRLGFLDGYPGLVYALIMSFHSFWIRVFQYEIITNHDSR